LAVFTGATRRLTSAFGQEQSAGYGRVKRTIGGDFELKRPISHLRVN
jgi:hypothetical protein